DDELIDMQMQALRNVATDVPLFAISSQAGKNVRDILRALRRAVVDERVRIAEAEAEADETEGLPVISLNTEKQESAWQVHRTDEDSEKVFVVTGRKIEKFAARTNFDQFQAVN